MHLTLKQRATTPAAPNFLQQQARFDAFLQEYNADRPHQALDMKVPADLYQPSDRPYCGLAELDYPLHDWASTVTGPTVLTMSPEWTLRIWRRRPDLNRGWRFCRPLPYHLATAPAGTVLVQVDPAASSWSGDNSVRNGGARTSST
jgi:hypothetical protein